MPPILSSHPRASQPVTSGSNIGEPQDEESVHANAWMFNQVLATGVHGIMLTHADTPDAVRAFVEAVRFPIHHEGVDQNGLKEGRRGVHGVPTAAEIWGVSQLDYLRKADPWPLNPNGELLLGVKEEDKYALANVEKNLKVPGIGMAEWGPADMAMSLGILTSISGTMLRLLLRAVSISRLSQSAGSLQRSKAEGVSRTRKCARAVMFPRMTCSKSPLSMPLKSKNKSYPCCVRFWKIASAQGMLVRR
jgi:hypothetical protein